MKTPTPTRPALPAIRKNRSRAFTLIELLVVISIIAILAGIAVPVFSRVLINAAQARDLSNAKQVGLGLRLYAGENSGLYPGAGSGTNAVTSSNAAFAALVPQYVQQEKIFYLAKSAWTPKLPDEVTSGASCLAQGENNFSYVTGLSDTSNPSFPLIADGFSASSVNVDTYSTNAQAKGGVWQGRNAIVLRADNSAAIEKVDPATMHVLGITAPDSGSANDIFASTANWLTSCTVLNPL